MMVVVAMILLLFISMHFKRYLKKYRFIILIMALLVSFEKMILGFLVNLCIFLIIGDVIKLVISKTRWYPNYQQWYVIVGLIISIVISGYGIYNAANVVITNYQITINKEFNNKRIMAISDVHLGTAIKGDDLKMLIAQANQIKPDLVTLAGDVFDEGTSSQDIAQAMNVFKQLAKKYPVYYVIGNHEVGYTSSPLKDYQLLERLKQAGVITLNDEYVEFEDINIIGRQDNAIKNRAELQTIIKGIDYDKPLLLLDHQPRSLKENKASGIDLMISGHTHAGQLFPMLPLWNLLGINEMNYGYRQDGNFNVIVSAGMGTWGFAMRTSKNCEIVVIDLCSGKK